MRPSYRRLVFIFTFFFGMTQGSFASQVFFSPPDSFIQGADALVLLQVTDSEKTSSQEFWTYYQVKGEIIKVLKKRTAKKIQSPLNFQIAIPHMKEASPIVTPFPLKFEINNQIIATVKFKAQTQTWEVTSSYDPEKINVLKSLWK